MKRALVLLVSGLAAGLTYLPAEQQGQWWALNGPKAIILNDQLKKLAEVDVGQNAHEPEYSPDRRYLAVSSDGARTSRTSVWSGRSELWPEPGSSSAVTILRADTLEVTGRRVVRFRPDEMRFIDNQTLVVVSSGQVSTKADKEILPAVTVLNVPGAEIRKEIDLESTPVYVRLDPETRLVHIACEKFDKRAAALLTLDPAAGTIRRTPLESDVLRVLPTSGAGLTYIELEDGVAVVNRQGDLVGAPIKAGKEKAFFAILPGTGRHLLGGRTGKNAKVVAIEDGRVVKEVAVERVGRCVLGDKTPQVIVAQGDKGFILDKDTLEVKGTLKLPGDYIDVMLDPAERNLYVFKGGSVAVIDLAQNKEIANVGVGSALKKWAAANTGYSYRVGPSIRGATPDVIASPVYTMVFSPSGSHLFVYHAGAQDLSIVDTANHTVDAKVGIGREAVQGGLWRLPGGRQLLAFKGKSVMAFDTEEGRLVAKKDFPDSLVAWDWWFGKIGVLFVRNSSGTSAFRVDSLDTAREFGPELALTPKALDDGREGMFFFWPERRFVITKPTGARMYDYDLNPVGDLEGVTGLDDVLRVEPPSASPRSGRPMPAAPHHAP